MKKINLLSKIGIAFALFIGITIACTKEVEVKDNFNFKLITNFSENGFIYETEDLTISIIQDRVIKTNKYFFKFQQEEGEGTFQIENGTIVHSLENEKIEVKRNEILKYLPTTVGHHKIKGTIYDLFDNKSEFTLETDIDYSPFTFIYTTATNVYPINQKSPTSLTYIQEGEENFKFEYYIEGGTGSLFLDDQELEQNEEIEMETGAMILKYLPTTLEEHTIHVKAIANDGGERNAQIVINVTNVDFNIQATPQGNAVNLNIDLPITISLTTADESGDVSYQIKYEYLNDSNTGVIKNQDNEEKAPGELWDIDPGSYQFTYNSQQEGDAEIKFTVIDSNEQEKEDTIIFSVENVPFTFTGSTVTNDIYINQETGFNFTLTPDGNTEAISYTVSYSQSQGNGVLKNQNGDVIAPNTDVDIEPGAFSFNFTPQSLGDHNLLFIAKDNFGQEVEVPIELTTEHIPVTFIVTATNSMIVGQTTNVNFVITPQITTDTTYEMNYILVGGEGELKNNTGTIIDTGTFQDVNTGSFVYTYSPSTQGNHVLNFQLRDSNTQIVLADKTIVVTNNNFTFTAVAEDDSILVNNQTNINCNLNTSVTGNTNYYLTMTKTGANANLSLNGNNLIAGNEMQFSPGSFTLVHEPLEVGNTHYTLTMRDDLGNEVIRDIDIEAGQLDFNLNVTQPQHIFINQANTFIFALVPTGTYDGITYQMSYDIQNPQLGNFDNHSEAVPFDVVPVSFNMNYTPTTLGLHEITFTVIDSNGQSHDYTETFEVVAADFTWTVNQSNQTILYNTPDNISAVLSQVVTNDNVSYSISYTINGGPGQLLDGNGMTLAQGTITPGSYNYQFIATQTGNYNVNLIITDNNNISHNVELNYTVIHTDFELYCSNLADMNNNTIQDFNINLTQNIDDTNIQYEIKFNVILSSTGDGNITDENDNILSGWQPVNIGVNNYKFDADTAGGVELLTEIREQGNDSTIKSCTSNFNVDDINISFACNMANNILILDQVESIEFNIQETPTTTDNYELKYEIVNPTGIIKNGNTTISSNTYIPVVANNPFYLSFTATSVGNSTILWTVKNSTTGQTFTCNSTITVNSYPPCDFSISGGAVTSTADVNDDVTVNFLFNEIADQGQPCNTDYKFSFTSTGNGTFTYNGQTKQANQEFDYNENINFGVYNGSSQGQHDLVFNFRNTYSSPTNHSFNTSINYEASDFNWVVNQSNQTIMINDTDNILAVLSQVQTNPNVTYTLNYTINGPGQLLDNNNQMVSNGAIVPGNFNWHFTSNQTGNTSIILTITDSYGNSHSQTLNYTINHTDFSIYCSALADMYVNGEQVINTDVSQLISDPNINYEIKYTLSGTGAAGVFDLSNNSINNTWHAITTLGIQDAKIKATSDGNMNLLIEVREQGLDNTIKSCSNDFVINPFTVTFTGSAQNSTINLNDNTNINFNITEVPSLNHSYTLSYTYQTGSGLLAQYNGGSVLATSTPITVALGQNTWNFTGTQVGNVSMNFVLTDVTTSETYPLGNTIDIVVNSVPYCNPTIIAQGTQTNAYIGENTPVNLTFGTDTVDTCQGNYEMYFTLPNGLNGEFILNGITKSPNQNFTNIDFGNITGVYKGLNSGSHNIVFHFINTDNNNEDSANININISDCDFTINGSFLTNGGNVGSDVAMLFDFDELGLDCNTTYQFRFSTTGGNGNTFTYNENEKIDGQWFDFNPTILSGIYTGVNSGDHNVTFEFESIATQTSYSFSDNITFNSPTFLLSCYGGGSSVELNVGEERQGLFTTVIDQSFTDPNVVYDVRYSFLNGDGIIKKDDGTVITDSQWLLNQAAGTYVRNFEATTSGNIEIQTEVRENNNLNTLQSCTTQFTVIEENCDFTFDIAEEENGLAPINTLQTIQIGMTQTGTNCNTPYQMYFTTERNGVSTSDGHLVYQGNNKEQGISNAFTITPGTFEVQFITDVSGEYEINFYITNPYADISTQDLTATIEFIDPNININLVSQDNDILVLNDATYNFEITGGSANYEVSVNPNIDVSIPSLKINNATKNWSDIMNTGNQIALILTPTQLAQNDSYTMHVHDIDNNINADYTFSLNSNQPTFTLQNVYLSDNDIWSDESTNLHVEVNTNGYNHLLTYNYEYGITGNLTDEDFTEGPPSPHNFDIAANGEIGNLQAIITVTNVEYGYSITQQVAFNSNDVVFGFDNININHTSNYNTDQVNSSNNEDSWIDYNSYYYLSFSPSITQGKYNIVTAEITLNIHNGKTNFYDDCSHYDDWRYTNEDIPFTTNYTISNPILSSIVTNQEVEALIYCNNTKNSKHNEDGTTGNDEYARRGFYYMKDLDNYRPDYTPTITVKLIDSQGNFKENEYILNNGYGSYSPQ